MNVFEKIEIIVQRDTLGRSRRFAEKRDFLNVGKITRKTKRLGNRRD